MVDTTTILIAFGLTLFAGLSTGIGSAMAFFTKRTNTKFLTAALGFSAGVMIYISFVEIFAESKGLLIESLGSLTGLLATVFAFFGGILLIAAIDRFLPSFENPHEVKMIEDIKKGKKPGMCKGLYCVGMVTAISIAIHNFPEGIATFASALTGLKLGIPIAIAVAIHNIPEGIAVSVPIYFATGSRKKAFAYSFLSGLSEPLGALICFFVLSYFLNGIALGFILAAVAGIMVFISLDVLLPAARAYGEHHLAIYSLLSGMAVMAFSLILLA